MAETGNLDNATTWSFISDADFREVGGYGKSVFVRGTTAGRLDLATNAATTTLLGVLITDPRTDAHGTVQMDGITKVKAGGSVTVFDFVTTNASGRATAADSGDVVLGQALSGASNDGELVTLRLMITGRHTDAP